VFADAVLGHSPSTDTLDYKDLERNRELWIVRAMLGDRKVGTPGLLGRMIGRQVPDAVGTSPGSAQRCRGSSPPLRQSSTQNEASANSRMSAESFGSDSSPQFLRSSPRWPSTSRSRFS
jgi:hypothetical protein